jgi:hypothetical protein
MYKRLRVEVVGSFDSLRLLPQPSRFMKLSTRLLRPIRETAFGKYDILRPNKPRMNRKSSPCILPLPVPFSIARPSYVPINFWSRKSEDDALVVDDEFSELEGWQGTIAEGGSSSDIGRIPLGGIEEQTVRYAGRLAAEVLNDAGKLVKVR